MKKRITCLLIVLVLSMMNGMWVSALPAMPDEIPEERQLPRLVDEADLLSDREESQLLAQLDMISEKHQCDVAVITVPDANGYDVQVYADDVYDYYGFGMGDGNDGILLLVSMAEREWVISTFGHGITAFTDAGLDYMADEFVPSLSDGDYGEAFEHFASQCDEFLEQAADGEPYDVGNMPRKPFPSYWILISIGIGTVIALIIMICLAADLKTVNCRNHATEYTRQNSLNVVQSHEMFLYRNVRRVRKAESSSDGGSRTHSSSSGRSHGGSRGKF